MLSKFRKFNILQAIPMLGIGGMEKTLQLFAEHLNKDLFNVRICGLYEGGVREDILRRKGFEVYVINGKKEELVKLMREKKIDILHIHRFADCDPFAIQAAQEAEVPIIIEENVFGRPDLSKWGKFIDRSLLISKMCAIRLKRWLNLSWQNFFLKYDVVYNPVDISLFLNNKPSNIIDRARIGSKKNIFLIGRHGRPSPDKWGDICIDMMKYLIKIVPNVKYIALGIPKEKIDKINKMGLKDYFIFYEPTISNELIIDILSQLDVFVYSSEAGESFGLAIAEAMSCAKPVVCNSTPIRDNAQVELIDHGKTGYIANNPKDFAKAVAELLLNEQKRREMGYAGYLKVKKNYNVHTVVKKLEKIYLDILSQKGFEINKEIKKEYDQFKYIPSPKEIIQFEEEYRDRIRRCYGKPNFKDIFLWEHFLSNYNIYKAAKKVKDFYIFLRNRLNQIR